ILFHHLMGGEGDTYLLANLYGFDTRSLMERYVAALHAVVGRHDILRTGVVWEEVAEPVQVVWRKARVQVEEVKLEGKGKASEELYERFNPRQYRIDVRQAPMLRCYTAEDKEKGRWLVLILSHHLVDDNTTHKFIIGEMQAYLMGKGDGLGRPLAFRNFVAQAQLGIRREEHEEFFRGLLGEVEEPTAPFGMVEVHGDGSGIEEGRVEVGWDVARRLREQARRLGVSVASVFELAWALVLARASASASRREDVVFGTVLFGRMQGGEGSDRVLGPFINTLPVRIGVGEEGVEASVRRTHGMLAD